MLPRIERGKGGRYRNAMLPKGLLPLLRDGWRRARGLASEKWRVPLSAQKEVSYFQEMQRAGYQRVDREVAAHRQYLMDAAKKEVGAYEQVKRELLEWLELPADSGSHTIRRRVTELRQQCDSDARVAASEDALARARISVEHALRLLPERKAA